MRLMNQLVVAVAIVALALMAGTAAAQQKGKGGFRGGGGAFGGGGNSLVTVSANEAVQKDVGISGEVATKITSLRDDVNAARQKELQTAGINFQNIQNM